jgi:hypothetical protein
LRPGWDDQRSGQFAVEIANRTQKVKSSEKEGYYFGKLENPSWIMHSFIHSQKNAEKGEFWDRKPSKIK